MSVQIDERAVVGSRASIGENVSIGPYAVIEDDVVIGDGTSIGPHAVIFDGARIGRDCKIFPGASIAAPPQDLKYKGEPTIMEIGDRSVIRECATLNRGTIATGKTTLGSDSLIMAYVHLAHDCQVGHHAILANAVSLAGHVDIGNYVIIGGLTPVHQFCRIGDHAMIGGAFRVSKDVPPYVLAGQSPMCFEKLNIVGLRRRGFSDKAIQLLDQTYRLLYRSRLNVSQAVEQIKKEVELIPEVQNVVTFIANSKRGIIPGLSRK